MQNTADNFTSKDMDDDSPEEAAAIGSSKYKVIPFPAESPDHPGGALLFTLIHGNSPVRIIVLQL
jgi:hypothetical protein